MSALKCRSEMHQNLSDNNVDDLVADLKSMSQLVCT